MSSHSDEPVNLKARPNKTLICSVLFLDIVAYSQKTVVEQINLKQRFNSILADCLKDIPQGDRIILDTGDGAAIGFLSDPEDALFVGMAIQSALQEAQAAGMPDLRVRLGINLGPVKVLKDINNQLNLIGDGINVAQRIMSFAEPGQLLVSRSYYDIVSCLSQEYARLFHYMGARADKHVREHDIYAVENLRMRPSAPVPEDHLRAAAAETSDQPVSMEPQTPEPTAPAQPVLQESPSPQRQKHYGWIAWVVAAILLVGGGVWMAGKFSKESPRESRKETAKAVESRTASETSKTARTPKPAKTEAKNGKAAEPAAKEKKSIEKEESRQEMPLAGSVRAEEIEFAVTGIKTSGHDKTITIRIHNGSKVSKSVALYDEYVRWPKSRLTDAAGKSHEVSKVLFTKGSQTITSKASGSQGVALAPHEGMLVSLTFKDIGSIKSFTLHPFIYVGRKWTEHDLPMKIGR